MNWYKKSQQEQLNLPGFPKTNEPFPIYGKEPEPKLEEDMFSGDPLEDIKEYCPPLTVKQIVEYYDLPYDTITFPKYDKIQMSPVMVITIEKNKYVIEDPEDEYPSIKEAKEWVNDISDMYLDFYLPEKPSFWEEVGDGFIAYHATTSDNAESIRKHGLQIKNESRGLSNRGTPSAIFATTEEAETESYGRIVIKIDVGKMKRDGYMPRTEMEEPVIEAEQRSSIANMIGIEDYDQFNEIEDGISPNTIVFYGNIPPKYLSFQ